MSFQRPTLTDLVTRIQADFKSRLDFVSAILRRSIVYVFARVYAGAVHMLHGHLEYLGLQLFPDTSDDDFLVRQAGLFGLTKNPPDYARATLALAGTNGSIVPAGTVLQSSAGFEYSTDADATIASGVASVNVTALVAGVESNLVVGAALTFESPVAGVNGTATATGVLQDGSDLESTESLRTRLKNRMAEAPMGGNDADYDEWAREVAGVTRVWVYGNGLGPGTVLVYFARDDDPSPIPDSGEVAAVQAKLDTERPSHATVTAAAPIDSPMNFTIHLSPDTADLRAAVTAALADFLVRTSSPNPAGSLTKLSALKTIIGITVTETNDYTLTTPSADVSHTAGQLARLGTITWT